MVLLALVAFAPLSYADHVWLHAPDGRGRMFDLASERGKIVAVTFATRKTQDEVREVNDQLAGLGVDIVTVVDFRTIPRIGHGVARHEMAKNDRPGHINVIDRSGKISNGLGIDPSKGVVVLLVDEEGVLRGRYNGLAEVDRATGDVAQLQTEARRSRRAVR